MRAPAVTSTPAIPIDAERRPTPYPDRLVAGIRIASDLLDCHLNVAFGTRATEGKIAWNDVDS